MFSPRAHQRSFSSKVFRTPTCRLDALRTLRQCFRVLVLLASTTGLVCVNSFAQMVDASRWANVSGWQGTVIASGQGSGTIPTICPGGTDLYKNTQAVTAFPVLQGAFAFWQGPFNSQASVRISDVETCPLPPPLPTIPCLQTITGMGTGEMPLGFILTIDSAAHTYTLDALDVIINGVHTGCSGPPAKESIPWGPVYGPDGTPIGGGIPANNIPLPANGVHLKHTIPTFTDKPWPFAVPWNISWDFSPVCKIDTSRLGPGVQGQGAPPWGGKPYDHDPGQTISDKGCALTCLSMALNFAGITEIPSGTATVPNDPGSLNNVMNNSPGDFGNGTSGPNGEQDFGVINWDPAVRDALCGGSCTGGKTSRFKYKPTTGGSIDSRVNADPAKAALDEVLCGANPHPVIVGVRSTDPNRRGFPGHFVLVTGRNADDTYDIVDPAGKAKSLNEPPYNGNFVTRGYVADPSGDVSGLDYFLSNNASILVTDPNGLQTGFQSTSGETLQAIPQSEYAEDALDNDVTEALATTSDHQVIIFQPTIGRYTVVVNGLFTGSYNLWVRAFSEDGSAQPSIQLQGTAQPGSSFTYIVKYGSTPGSTVVVTPMPGDRNGDGVVNCSDLDLVKASFGKMTGQTGFDPRADVNGDGTVNILDLSAVARQLPTGMVCK
jgi:hypothetical protein